MLYDANFKRKINEKKAITAEVIAFIDLQDLFIFKDKE